MTALIPLASTLDPAEIKDWLSALNAAAGGHFEIRPLEALTPEEQASVRVAIVAQPDLAALEALPDLRWVQSLWAGVDRLLRLDPRIGIARMQDPAMAETMAEAVLAWTLYLHRDMPLYAAQQRQRLWLEQPLKRAAEQPVGLLGAGRMGAAAARRLQAQGFPVLAWSRSGASHEGLTVLAGEDGLRQVLQQSRILVCLLPLTAETRGLLDAVRLALLPRGAGLLNFARGPILEEAALLAALDSGALSHAVLDVFPVEPLPEAHPFWSHPQVTVLPHVTAPTDPRSASILAVAAIRRWLADGTLPVLVDRSRGY